MRKIKCGLSDNPNPKPLLIEPLMPVCGFWQGTRTGDGQGGSTAVPKNLEIGANFVIFGLSLYL
jgi:hypothetical protein